MYSANFVRTKVRVWAGSGACMGADSCASAVRTCGACRVAIPFTSLKPTRILKVIHLRIAPSNIRLPKLIRVVAVFISRFSSSYIFCCLQIGNCCYLFHGLHWGQQSCVYFAWDCFKGSACQAGLTGVRHQSVWPDISFLTLRNST